jgi:hypothetical protein
VTELYGHVSTDISEDEPEYRTCETVFTLLQMTGIIQQVCRSEWPPRISLRESSIAQ